MSDLNKIAAAMGGEVSGNRAIFPTPGHSAKDRGSWASIVPTAPDGVLIHVSNDDERKALEIKDRLRNEGALPRFEPQANIWRVTGTYEYADADGTILYRTVRKEKAGERKRFVAERVEGRGWASGLGDMDRVLYRLPEIKAAIGKAILTEMPGPTVYLVEGERKADKLASWGCIATAVAFGAKGWRKGYAEALEGCKVIILPDNDDPGREFAERAAMDIEAAGGKASIIQLPGLPPKGDIMDWTGSVDDLRALVDKVTNPPVETFGLADLALWDTIQAKPKPFIMPGFVPAGEVTLATGAGGGNKSTFGQQLATCCAAGVPMLGVDVARGTALYLTAEDDDDRLHWMQEHICKALGVRMADLAGKLHLGSLRGRLSNELATFDAEGRLRPSGAFAILKATIDQTGANLIVLDNAAHLFAGNENDRQQVTAFVNLLYSLCRDRGVTIILVAHTNKAGDTYSGSTAWLNAVRSQIVLQRPECSIDPDERILTLGKANYARPGEELRFRWHDFALVRDSDLSDDTRAQLAESAAAAGANAAFIDCLRARNEQGDGRQVGPSSGPNYAPSQFEGMPQAKGFKKEALKRAMDRLYALGRIKSETVFDRKAKRDKTVIVEADEASHNAHNARTTAAQHAPTTPHNDGTTGGQHTPIYKYIPGAASTGPAPDLDSDNDLDADGNIIGWNDEGRH